MALLAWAAGVACAQTAFVKVGPETVYDAGDRCGVPWWDFGDFNGDGRRDFALYNYPTGAWTTDSTRWKPAALMLWIAQPDGSYKEMASQMFSGPVTASYAAQVRVADFNGDGIPDIYLPSYGPDNSAAPALGLQGDTPKLALSTPAGFVDASAQFVSITRRLIHTGAIADIDGNGTVDLYVGSNTGAPVPAAKPFLLLNDGKGNFAFDQSRLPAVVLAQTPQQGARSQQIDATTWRIADERFTGSVFADVNRDGFADLIVVPGPWGPSGLVFLNDGRGDFSKLPPIELPAGAYGGNWLVATKNAAGGWNFPMSRGAGPGTVQLDTRAIDLNGDGYPDLAILQTLQQDSPSTIFYRGGRIQLLVNQGGRGFVDESAARGAPGYDATADTGTDNYHSTLTVADVNGDGYPDLIAIRVRGTAATPHVFLNDGNGRFTRAALPGMPEDGLYIVLSGGFQQPTRVANVRFTFRQIEPGWQGCTLRVQTWERPAPVAATAANYQGLWWASPANSESGWGINFAHQGDTIFATWFTYDAAGKAWWLSMTAARTADSTYAGSLIQTGGPAFSAQPFDPGKVTRATVGSGTIAFSGANNGTLAYTVNGTSQTKSITRQVFGPMPTCSFAATPNFATATNYQDLWWVAGGAESGWGVNLTHQGDNIFATWFTYDVDGTPLWLSATASKTAPGVYSGELIRTAGPAFNAVPFNPVLVTRSVVGTATLTFANGNAATFAYTVNGVAQSKAITRQLFAPPAGTLCQ